MSLLRDLTELVEARVISEETAREIKRHFDKKSSSSQSRLLVVFGILGALLTGLGIILIVAHNWDTLSQNLKLAFSFIPLIVAQILCGYTLLKRSEGAVWREGTATFLILSVGATIALVSQIYNMESDLAAFLFIWTILSIPVIYIMKSSMASMVIIMAITWYACELSYFGYGTVIAWKYWILLAAVVPHYVTLYNTNRKGNFFHVHSWLLVISVTIALGMFADDIGRLMIFTYISFFSILIIIDELGSFDQNRISISAYRVVGNFGTIVLFLFLSFSDFWTWSSDHSVVDLMLSIDSYSFWVVMIVATILLIRLLRRQTFSIAEPLSYGFVSGVLLVLVSIISTEAAWLMANVTLLLYGVHTIRKGARFNMLGIMNFGLLIISSLIIARFFDLDLSFVVRGVLFMAVGVGFILMNFYIIRKKDLQKGDNQKEI